MTSWTADELSRIGDAEELEIAARRGDGRLIRRVPIWVVRVADELYVRSWRGETGGWFLTVGEAHRARPGADQRLRRQAARAPLRRMGVQQLPVQGHVR